MTKCFSFTASRNWCLRTTFNSSGLRSTINDLGDGTTIHCWVPKTRKPTRPDLLLLHGFGANAMWQWGPDIIPRFVKHFNVYVPDLVFFGDSFTTRSERTESFQAQCVHRVMEMMGVEKVRVVGLSYGGFVAYSLAAQFKDMVERVVICCAGVCLEEKDLVDGLFPVKDLASAADMLLPQTPEMMKELMRLTFVKPMVRTPNCILVDFIEEMNREHVKEKKELVYALGKDRKLSELPRIPQPTKIIWGDKDQVFPMELAYRLKRHLGDNADLVVIKNTGHAYIVEKPKEFYKHLKSFLLPQIPPVPSATTPTANGNTAETISTTTATATVTANHHNPNHLETNGSVTNTINGDIDVTLTTSPTTTKHHDPNYLETNGSVTNTINGDIDVTLTTSPTTTKHHDPNYLETNGSVTNTTNGNTDATLTTTLDTTVATTKHHDPNYLQTNGLVTVST